MKFSGVITINRSDTHRKGQDQMLKLKVTDWYRLIRLFGGYLMIFNSDIQNKIGLIKNYTK